MRRTPTSTGLDASHTKLWRLWFSFLPLVVESDFVLAIDGHAACWTPQRDRDKNELNAECQMIWQKSKSFLNPHSLLWWTVWLILITIVSLIPQSCAVRSSSIYIDRHKMIFTICFDSSHCPGLLFLIRWKRFVFTWTSDTALLVYRIDIKTNLLKFWATCSHKVVMSGNDKGIHL